jgi:hypothetical protein
VLIERRAPTRTGGSSWPLIFTVWRLMRTEPAGVPVAALLNVPQAAEHPQTKSDGHGAGGGSAAGKPAVSLGCERPT